MNLIIRTFNIQNLRLSLPYIENFPNHQVILHNDNPQVKVAYDGLMEIAPNIQVKEIINEEENVGMFMSFINSIGHIDFGDPYTMLLDDDDVALPLKNMGGCKAILNKPLRSNMRSIIDFINFDRFGIVDETYYCPHYLGCYWDTSFLRDLNNAILAFLPRFTEIWGSTYINANEDHAMYGMAKVFYEESAYSKYDFEAHIPELGMLYNMSIPPCDKKYLVKDFMYCNPQYGRTTLEQRRNFERYLRTSLIDFREFCRKGNDS